MNPISSSFPLCEILDGLSACRGRESHLQTSGPKPPSGRCYLTRRVQTAEGHSFQEENDRGLLGDNDLPNSLDLRHKPHGPIYMAVRVVLGSAGAVKASLSEVPVKGVMPGIGASSDPQIVRYAQQRPVRNRRIHFNGTTPSKDFTTSDCQTLSVCNYGDPGP